MSFDSLLINSMAVYAQTNTQDSLGSIAVTEAASVAAWPCRLEALSGRERAMYGGVGVEVTHKVFCRVPTPTVGETDELEISGVRYRVQFVDPIQGRIGVDHLEIIVGEKRHG
jgi:hypothetical protein